MSKRSKNGRYVIRDRRGYISIYDYKANRESLSRARTWVSLENVNRYLNTDSFRRLAQHTDSDIEIQEITAFNDTYYFYPTAAQIIRTIPLAEVRAAAALASTKAERKARGLRN